MPARPSTIDQYSWLTPSRRKRRQARLKVYGKAGVVLACLAIPQLAATNFDAWNPFGNRARSATGRKAEGTPMPKMIESPFAPKSLRPLSAQDAVAWNAKIAPSKFAVQVASPLSLMASAGTGLSRSLQCMTAAVYYEARSESTDGQRAVAQVVLNRMRHPEFPHSVCGVVFQGSERPTGCQFSFTCDGSLSRAPAPEGWRRAESVAAAALAGSVYAPVGWATHYHADYVVPYWAPTLQKLATVGHHIFYRWGGAAGDGGSFTSRYTGAEPQVAALAQPDAQLAQTEVALAQAGVAKRVSAAERPLIEAAAALAPSAPATAQAAQPAPPAQAPPSSNDRWIIGTPPPN